MEKLTHLFIPHKKNDHRPYLTRHPAIASLLLFIMTVQTTLNIFVSTRPQILGFATSIYQQEIISLTNQERKKQGLPDLKHNPQLDEAARLKAQHMFEKNYWAHVSPDGVDPWHWFAVAKYTYLSAGENLAQGFDTSRGVVSGWMASPTHRDNIMYDKFTEIGVAILNGTLEGEDTTLVVQLFGTPPATQIAVNEPIQPAPTKAITKTPTKIPPTLTPTIAQVPTDSPTSAPTEPQTVPTVEPSPTEAFAMAEDNDSVVIGPTAGFTNTPPARLTMVLAAVSDLRNLSISRILTMFVVTFLIMMFVVDSYVIWRKQIKRENAHRFVYASILILALINMVYTSAGMVL